MAGLFNVCGGGYKTFEKYSLTNKLWDENITVSGYLPFANPVLALFDLAARQDLLVVYNYEANIIQANTGNPILL